MWKFVTRGIRESIERRVCRTNVYSQSSQDEATTETNTTKHRKAKNSDNFYNNKYLPPCLASLCHGYCASARQHNGPKGEESHNKYDAKYTWTGAVGWSSILAIGYVVCQSMCFRRKLYEIDSSNADKWQNRLLTNPKFHASRLLGHLTLPQPKYILPISKKPIETEDKAEILYDEIDRPSSSIEQPYGPVTAQEAYKQAVDNFSFVHESVLGELELNFGSEAIEEERFEDAVEHFICGAKLSSPGSMFNLGLCYELGVGISKDYTKAVEFYKQAADKGHADAMYNLGVFHAQGKGGLKINRSAAKQLFTEAAKQGQVQALKALQLERSYRKRSNLDPNPEYKLDVKTMNNNHLSKSLVTTMMSYNILNHLKDQTTKSDQLIDSYDQSLQPESPTDSFLEMLGVRQRSAIPLISVGEGGP